MKIYFPDSKNQLPKREYLLNVCNTVDYDSVIKGVHLIRKKREKQEIEVAPILLTNEFSALFASFKPISTNQKYRRMNLVS